MTTKRNVLNYTLAVRGIFGRNRKTDAMPTTPLTLEQLYRRLIDPRARRHYSTAIERNGSRRVIYGCVCGSTHSASNLYPHHRRAAHVLAWESDHVGCMGAAVAAALAEQSPTAGLAALAPDLTA